MNPARLTSNEARRLVRRLSGLGSGSSEYNQIMERFGFNRHERERGLVRTERMVGRLAQMSLLHVVAAIDGPQHDIFVTEVREALEATQGLPRSAREAEAFWAAVSWVIPIRVQVPFSLAYSIHYLIAPEHIAALCLWLRAGRNSTSWDSPHPPTHRAVS